MDVIIPVGYAFFDKSKYSSPALYRLLIFNRKEILYKDKWKIYEDTFDKRWAPIFANMREAHVVTLYLDNNRFPAIASCLRGVLFSRLKEISLQNNRILSLQLLGSIKMPEVETINLQNNHISNIKSLRKNAYKKLKYLNLSNNRIQQMQSIVEFNNSGLGKLVLQWNDSQATSQNIYWMAKMNTKGFNFIRIQSRKRIKQTKMDRMMAQLHPAAEIWRYGH